MNLIQQDNTVRHGNHNVLEALGTGISSEADPLGHGLFLHANAKETNSRLIFELGSIAELERFTACHRYEPYWMKSVAGDSLKQVPSETQWLLARLKAQPDGTARWLLVVPLIGDLFRFSLRAALGGFTPNNAKLERLALLAETGDPFAVGLGGLAAFVALGDDPFELCERSARSVMAKLKTGRLRTDKPLPDVCDRFGWCTWDAFYQEVSHDNVQRGLLQFKEGGVEPRWLILDDGWQSVQLMPTGEKRLTAFAANSKFPQGLKATVRMSKEEFKVERFLVWHTITGYWGGVDGKALEGYGVVPQVRRFGEGIMEHRPAFNELWWGSVVGLVAQEHAARFFDDYHQSLVAEGVDGIKVDSQAMLEALACGQGGRLPLTQTFRRALEGSAQRHFNGRLINCMSNGQETWYGGQDSTLLRSSIDFFPRFPESHGDHLYANAQVGVWFGHFMQPDWDMFQSGHEWGAFHAAGRAVSGGPVYASDKPGVHDFALLRKLVCSDGSVLRCDQPGVPTLDTLCSNPTSENVLLKIQNRNRGAGIVGVFNCRYAESGGGSISGSNLISGTVSPSDVKGLSGPVACFAHRAASLERMNSDDKKSLSLNQGEFELLTFVPIEQGFAAIGLTDKFNSSGAVHEVSPSPQGIIVHLRDGGTFLAYCEQQPSRVECNGIDVAFSYCAKEARLEVILSTPGPQALHLRF